MKLIIDQSKEHKEVEIIIKCGIVDKRLEKLIAQIRLYSFSIAGKKGNKIFNIALEDVYYFESVDEKSFIYTKDDVFETEYKLYALEKDLVDSRFVRISKACILNIENLLSVKALLNGRYEATMNNNEKLIINRHYVPSFKEKFDL